MQSADRPDPRASAPPPRKGGLGRGLGALIPTLPPEEVAAAGAGRAVDVNAIEPNPYQPRAVIEPEALQTLAASIRAVGVIQPLVVAEGPERGRYVLIAGERRWRAAQKAQLHDVPVVIRTIDDHDALQIGLVENLQRSDLTAIDEAQGYKRLIEDYSHTQEELARMMGRSRPHIANTLRLLDLPPPVQEMVRDGALSAGQARTLIGVPDPQAMARRAIAEKLSVRDLERIAGETKTKTKTGGAGKTRAGGSTAGAAKSADTKALERRLEEALGLKVDLSLRGLGEQSVLTLEIRDFDQLDTVVDKLTRR